MVFGDKKTLKVIVHVVIVFIRTKNGSSIKFNACGFLIKSFEKLIYIFFHDKIKTFLYDLHYLRYFIFSHMQYAHQFFRQQSFIVIASSIIAVLPLHSNTKRPKAAGLKIQ